MKSGTKRDQISKELRDEQLHKAEKLLQKELDDHASELIELLQKTYGLLNEGKTEEGLKNFAESIRKKIPGEEKQEDITSEAKRSWIDIANEIVKDVDEKVVLEQQEERFIGDPADTFFIKTAKIVKRTVRGSQKLAKGTSNGFRKLFGKEARSLAPWTQTVPLRNIILLRILELSSWEIGWKNEFSKIEAEVLLESDAWTLHSSGLLRNTEAEDEKAEQAEHRSIPNEEDLNAFFKEAIKKVEEIQASFEDKLKDSLDNIARDVETSVTVIGTAGYSAGDYTNEKLEKRKNDVLQSIENKVRSWQKLLLVLANRVDLSMNFRVLYGNAKKRVIGFVDSINELFNNNLEDPLDKFRNQLDKAISIFEGSEERSVKQVRELSDKHREQMGAFFQDELLKKINELVQDAVFSTKLERFTSAIPDWTKDQPEKAVLVEELDLAEFPPKYEFEHVDWQILVQRVVNNQMAKELLPKVVKPEQFLSSIYEELREISQIIYTNLEVVEEVKKSDEEEPFEVAREGLLRAKAKLDELENKIKEKKQELNNKLLSKHEISFSRLAELLEKQDVTDVRLAGAEYKAKETATDWKTKLQVFWANLEDRIELIARFIWKKLKYYTTAIRDFLGFTEKEEMEGDSTDLATFLSETDEQVSRLPFIYRRLFDFHKEVDERFFMRRPEQFERFKKGYELWRNDFPSSFAVIGEKGSGKTIFVSLLEKEVFTKNDVIDIKFQETLWEPEEIIKQISTGLKIEGVSTIEELIEAIGRKKKRVVVVVENIQNCYIRNINGFEAIEHLMYLISETNKNILWVVSSTRYGWLYLDKVLNVADYFTHLAEADNLSADQIKELILRRHRASGYQLKFLPDEATKKSRNYRKIMDDEEKSQEYLSDKYFEKLAKLAEGNPSIAMIFWIRSINDFDDTYFYINAFDFGTVNRIDGLENEELFALAAFVLHDFLMPEEMSQILHKSLRDCKLTVSRLVSRSILLKTDHGYILNHLIYRQVVRVLKEANFIH